MKKLILGLMIAALALMGVTGAFADNTQLTDYKYLIVNDNADKLFTAIPTAVLDPVKHRVLMFEVMSLGAQGASASTETVACLYDATTLGSATNKVAEGEVESNDADGVVKRYERPLNLKNGVVIGQGAFTIVMVEWEYKY